MINIQNVTHHYGVNPVLRNVNLHVRRGELLGVMGPNGTGKSTLLKLAAGVLWPVKGEITIDGLTRRSSEENERTIRRRTVYLPTDPWLPPTATGREYLLTVGRLYKVDDERLFDHATRLLRLFHLETQAAAPLRSYSTGQRQKIALCAAFITEAPVMILDEPFSGGLDPAGIVALGHLLKRLADRADVTVLLATPVPELVEPTVHRVAILHEGSIVACDSPDELRRQSGSHNGLAEVIQRIVNPDTQNRIDDYFLVNQC